MKALSLNYHSKHKANVKILKSRLIFKVKRSYYGYNGKVLSQGTNIKKI
jgi:hypothetical protein